MASDKRGWSVTMVVGVPAVGAILLGIVWTAMWRLSASGVTTRGDEPERLDSKPQGLAERLARAPVQISQHVYILGDMWPSAVYLVETTDGLAMIDAGLESAHDRLVDGMSNLGLDLRRLRIILLTHAHGDHSMGAQRLREETGAHIYVGQKDAEPLRRGGPWEAVFSHFEMPNETPHPTTIDGELADEQILELGQARFLVIGTPGHTPGSCCFLLEIDGQRLLFTGDTLMSFTAGTGTYSSALPPRYRGDVVSYLLSLQKLRRLPPPDLILPGHPASERVPVDPRLRSEDWYKLVEQGIAELEELHRRHVRDGGDFLDGHPKEILDGLYYLGDFDGHAAYARIEDGRALLFGDLRGRDAVRRLEAAWQTLSVTAPRISAVVLTSCQAETLSGLDSLVENTGCTIAVPHEGLEAVRAKLPDGATIVSSEELPSLGWDGVVALPLAGTGEPQAAYYFHLQDSLVLVSGTAPIDGDEDEFAKLSRQGLPRAWDARLLAESLERLREITPDVWLSALPWRGRNANLYDDAWSYTIESNLELLRRWDTASRRRMPP
jgi:glyoxylase-like metal-dependent hydrolase (beta-lactamase superfamily II)